MKLNNKIIILFVFFTAALCFARSPKVIRIFPENGAVDVKPGPTKIRILFDQDMTIGKNYSLCGAGENFPEIIGEPKWTGRRAFVFSANLKPNHEYMFGINSPSAQNFKSIRGEPAEVLVVQFRTAGDGSTGQENPATFSNEDNLKAFEQLSEAIDNYYSYRDEKDIDWDRLFEKYRPSLVNAPNPKDFAKNAALMLSQAKDKHIWLKVNGEHITVYRKPVTPNADFKSLPQLVPNFKKHNASVCTGQFPNGIGYILIDSWSRQNKKDFDQLYIALKQFSDAPALIIDVRGNGGGSEPLAQAFAGCFVDKPKLYAKHVTVAPESSSGFTKPSERILQPNKEHPRYRGEIAVLTGPVVMSSCEAFVLMMKQVPGCKIIGASTQGSSGNPKSHDLGNGVSVYLPSWKAMLPDGTCFEGKGIRPDIPVRSSNGNSKNDPVIEVALKVLGRNR